MRRRWLQVGAALVAASGFALVTTASAPSGATAPRGSAQAYAIRVALPGGGATGTPQVAAPPDTVSLEGGFAYPEDGSVVTTGSATASASASGSGSARAQASAEVASLSLFGGEVTVAKVTARARASTDGKGGAADTSGTAVSGLSVLGQAASGSRVQLGDWGVAVIGGGTTSNGTARSRTKVYRASATALTVTVTAPHGGLPAGAQIVVGQAASTAQAERPVPKPPPKQSPGPSAAGKKKPPTSPPAPTPKPPEPEPPKAGKPPVRRGPSTIAPRLTPGGYVFPVYGPSSWSDDYGVPSRNPTIGWHHGIDIFAPLGAPVLAVNRGTVFSVGWNDLGGNRLWLRDDEGNQFYYAHLSAYSPLAVNGRRVEAGEVVGFVGNTGDAVGGPTHLHFEIHPVGLLSLGYDGAVNPTPYLSAWQHLQDVSFPKGGRVRAWAPRVSASSTAPEPGAFLVQASDISQASGLEPHSLMRALRPPSRGNGVWPAD